LAKYRSGSPETRRNARVSIVRPAVTFIPGKPMASNTKITKSKRNRKLLKMGKKNKKARIKEGTPKFPIHPEDKSE
jgi:hypothetical protein